MNSLTGTHRGEVGALKAGGSIATAGELVFIAASAGKSSAR